MESNRSDALGQDTLSLLPAVHLGRGVTTPVGPGPRAVDAAERTDTETLHALESHSGRVIRSGGSQQLLK